MATIDRVDFLYFAMPDIADIGDGSQDMVLVRLEADGRVGWGECEAAPLPTLAAWAGPMSHSACHPVRDSVLNAPLDGPDDIVDLARRVRARSLDLLQADHALSGIEIAAWDWLGHVREQPVYSLLGQDAAHPKVPYASSLFGDTPEQTEAKAVAIAEQGYHAVKFGWGPFGTGTLADDESHVAAARAGLGPDRILLIDAGTVFGEDVDAAAARIPVLEAHHVTWLEEPFTTGALHSYRRLAVQAGTVKLAGGEGAHNAQLARNLIDFGGIGYVQIDTGRIGGIQDAYEVARCASAKSVRFVNHTFTTHLALSASLQPYAGSAVDDLCEYPVEQSDLARVATTSTLGRDTDGLVHVPAGPGLGVTPDLAALAPYLVDVEISAGGHTYYRTPSLSGLLP